MTMPDRSPDPVLTFQHVSVERAGRRVLEDVTVDIPEGRVSVIAGPSGVGKTTMLRLCDRLEVADRGHVLYRGRDVMRLDPLRLRREVAMVFQQPVMVGGTVRDNLTLATTDVDEESFVAVLHQAELDASFLDRPADELSGGEAQRVSVARALLTRPAVLLADEPTSGLDPTPRLAFERLARRLASRQHLTVVWVTHDLEQLRRLADHVVVLLAGRIAYHGPPERLDREPHLSLFLTGEADAAR